MESYFEYCIKQCDDEDIAIFCDLYKTKAEILRVAKLGFGGCTNILVQGYLIPAASTFLEDNGLAAYDNMNRDLRKLYDRYTCNIKKMKSDSDNRILVDNDALFDVLVDLIWLIPSLYKPYTEGELLEENNGLIESRDLRIQWLKTALKKEAYDYAWSSMETSEHFKEAQNVKYSFFPRLIPYSEVRSFIETFGDDSSQLKRMEKGCYLGSIESMSLFFGLIATAARAEKIRREVYECT